MCAKDREGLGRTYYMKFILIKAGKSWCGELVKTLGLRVEIKGQRSFVILVFVQGSYVLPL